MNEKAIKKLEEHAINCELLYAAVEILEKLRSDLMPNDLPQRWIEELKQEAGFQVSQHDEDMRKYGA